MQQRMVFVGLFMLFLGLFNPLSAQNPNCQGDHIVLYKVTAPSGLSLREAPNQWANKLGAAAPNRIVSVCDPSQSIPDTIDGHSGQWVYANYGQLNGWMFDAYLYALSPIRILPEAAWLAVEEEANYLALYPQNNAEQFTLQPYTSAIANSSPKSPSAIPILLIEGLSNENANSISGRSYQSKFIYPGEMTYFSLGENQYYLYAKGAVQLNKATEDPNPFGSIRNYELRLKKVVGDQTQEETLFKMDIPAWFGQGYEGGIFLEWMGDLDCDQELDLLLTRPNESNCWEHLLFLSSKAARKHLTRLVSKHRNCEGC